MTTDTILSPSRTIQPAGSELTFLTLNAQKAGANSPFMVEIVAMLDQHTSDFLFLTEISIRPHTGSLTNALRNRGYTFYYHPSNVASQNDVLPEVMSISRTWVVDIG
jgi:hypothetical protein